MNKCKKFLRCTVPAGTRGPERPLYIDAYDVEAVYPVPSTTDVELSELRMSSGREYIVIGKVGKLVKLLEKTIGKKAGS